MRTISKKSIFIIMFFSLIFSFTNVCYGLAADDSSVKIDSNEGFKVETQNTINELDLKKFRQIYEAENVYKETLDLIEDYKKQYSDITRVFSIGKSINGKDIMVIKVGNGSKSIFINAGHNTNDYITTVLLLNQIELLCEAYEKDLTIENVNVKSLLNNVSLYFTPMVNTDGIELSIDNSETQNIKSFCEQFKFDLTIEYKTKGEKIICKSQENIENENSAIQYANLLGGITGYTVQNNLNNELGVSFSDWAIDRFKKPYYIISVAKDGSTYPISFDSYNEIWEKNKNVLVILADKLKNTSIETKVQGVKIILNNSLGKDNCTKRVNGRVYVSANDFFKGLEAEVNGNSIKIENTGSIIEIFPNSRIILIDNISIVLSSHIKKIDGALYIPIRAVSEALGLDIQWEAESFSIFVNEPYKILKKSNLDKIFPETIVKAKVTNDTAMYESVGGKYIESIKRGEYVAVERDSNYKWYKVKTSNGNSGWVKVGNIAIDQNFKTNIDLATKEELEFYVRFKKFESKTPYLIWVDLSRQKVNVFKRESHDWLLSKSFTCATGKNNSPTVKGEFTINSHRGTWMPVNDEIGVKYFVGFYPRYYFHSIKLTSKGNVCDSTLGKVASAGCIRLAIEDSKWIYEYISTGTKVYIY